MKTKIAAILMLIIGFLVAVAAVIYSLLITINFSDKWLELLITSGFTAAISGTSALSMEKNSKYKENLRGEILDLSILSSLSFLIGLSNLIYDKQLIIFFSILFLFWGFSIFILTLIFERLNIYENILNISKS